MHWLKINKEAEVYFLQRTGCQRKKRAIWYWIRKGRHSVSQKKIKLRAKQRPGVKPGTLHWYTSEEWIDDFIRKVRQ